MTTTERGETLTPYRRAHLYAKTEEWATSEVDGDADEAVLLVHALAATPDGPLQVREDYLNEGTVPEADHTDQERISGWIEFYGTPLVDPASAVALSESSSMFTAVVTVRGESSGGAADFEAGLRARLDEFNGGAGDDMVYPEVLSVVVRDALAGEGDRSLTQAAADRAAPRDRDAGDDSPAGAGHDVQAERG